MFRGTPFFSRVPTLQRKLLQGRRKAYEKDSVAKLAIMRRLQGRYITCNLPKVAETRVEQSFNEQLFGKVLGYQTLLSHPTLPFHLSPKSRNAIGRYDDFSLGFFGVGDDRVIASAELKSPGCNLDSPQRGGSYGGISPVEQACRMGRELAGCRWVLVSNFRELRLYDLTDWDSGPVSVIDLLEVKNPETLSFLCAHFDRQSLLGKTGCGDLMSILQSDHPAAPISARPTSEEAGKACQACRLVMTFTPENETEARLSYLYDEIRRLAVEPLRMVPKHSKHDYEEAWRDCRLDFREGWIAIRTSTRSFAASALGQVAYSESLQKRESEAQHNPDVGIDRLSKTLFRALEATREMVNVTGSKPRSGRVDISLYEVKLWSVHVDGDLIHQSNVTNGGTCAVDEIHVGPLIWDVDASRQSFVALCLAEIGIHFAGETGARFRFDHGELVRRLGRYL
jgi:hypothetical protein